MGGDAIHIIAHRSIITRKPARNAASAVIIAARELRI